MSPLAASVATVSAAANLEAAKAAFSWFVGARLSNANLQETKFNTTNLQNAIMDDLLANSTFKELPKEVTDYQVNQCLNYYYTMANYYGYDLDSFVQTAAGYENADALLEGMSDSITTYSKEALLYQAVAETLDIVPTQEQIDTYSSYTDTYGENYCTMVALMDAVTDALTESAVVS